MKESSHGSGNVYDLLKADNNVHYRTNNENNSYIEASLRKGTFIIKNYTIRGNKYDRSWGQMQSWKLEGQKASDGNWILLDHHEREPFDKLLVKNFNVICKERLKAVRLTQTEHDTHSESEVYLCINFFDIFGTILSH